MTLLQHPQEHAQTTLQSFARAMGNETQRRPLWGILGGGLIGFGLCRRSLFGLSAVAIGSILAYEALREQLASSPQPAPETSSTFQFGFPVFSGGDKPEPDDEVDEASMESFPASDPPAYATRRS